MKAKEKVRKANLTQWSTKFQDQASSGLTVKEWCSKKTFPFTLSITGSVLPKKLMSIPQSRT